ncbi:MAG TPA: NUDIX hydrolase [Hyphomicrobium sp.]|nr:NUDIX hydrolase [Hyphomicrobium sp.]
MQVKSGAGFPHENGVKVVSRCVLTVVEADWPYAAKYAAEIDAHWQNATAANPSYFNGVVHLITEVRSQGSELHASLIRTDFKSYLYWRSLGFPDAGVIDGFGSALIRSSEGKFVLVWQRPGNVNHGFVYLPSGFIDERDVLADGTIDIASSVAREIEEELGEAGSDLQREEGFIIVRSGAQLCFAVPFYSPKTTDEFAVGVAAHNAVSENPELEGVIPVGALEDLATLKTLPYARLLLEALLVAR